MKVVQFEQLWQFSLLSGETPWETPAKAQGRLGLEEESTNQRWNHGILELWKWMFLICHEIIT